MCWCCSLLEVWLGVVQTTWERVNRCLPGGGWRARPEDWVGAPPGGHHGSQAGGVDTVTDRAPKHDALTHGSLLIHWLVFTGKQTRLHGIAYCRANRRWMRLLTWINSDCKIIIFLLRFYQILIRFFFVNDCASMFTDPFYNSTQTEMTMNKACYQ